MRHSPRKQRGAILVVALIMLLLLTLIGIGSMQGTTLQERMAGNMRDEGLAFQAAETALRQGEATLTSISTIQNMAVTRNETTISGVEGVVAQPKYWVTPIPGVTLVSTGSSLEAGQAIDMGVARVESEGYGATTNSDNSAGATVKLRSIYIVR